MAAVSRIARGERLSGSVALAGTGSPTLRDLRFEIGPAHLSPGVQIGKSRVDLLDQPLRVIQPVLQYERQQLIGRAACEASEAPQPLELGGGNGSGAFIVGRFNGYLTD